jgi:hypothetical protein
MGRIPGLTANLLYLKIVIIFPLSRLLTIERLGRLHLLPPTLKSNFASAGLQQDEACAGED